MSSCVPIVSLSSVVLLSADFASALGLQLPPPGEDVAGQVRVIKAKCEDIFADLGEQYNLGYNEMVIANPGVDPWLSGVGTEMIIPTCFVLPPGPREDMMINLVEYRLYYYPKGQNVVHTYPLDIGREGQGSPVTNTRITTKTKGPAWCPPVSIRVEYAAGGDPLPIMVPPGLDNSLGPYKLTLGVPGYLIHSLSKKSDIDVRTSHDCFRTHNTGMTHLLSVISVDTSVRIINKPYKFGVGSDKVYPEVHTPPNDHDDPSVVGKHIVVINTLLERDDLTKRVQLNWDVVREVVASEDGVPVEIAQKSTPAMTATMDNDPTQLMP